ncbi:HupE/UreJ family protein [Pacificispira sp.]|uniref:HupE/UreJ family protein n=1 Tax=Pacificispira sp. TaxID=2888761 RepID=UPI003B5232B2
MPQVPGCKVLISLFLWFVSISTAAAHEITPTLASLTFADGRYRIEITTNLEALLAGIGPEHADTADAPGAAEYDAYRRMPPEGLRDALTAFTERLMAGVDIRLDGVRVVPDLAETRIPPVGDTDLPRETTLVLEGALVPGSQALTWGWSADFGSSVIRAQSVGGGLFAMWLQNGDRSPPIPVIGAPARSVFQVAWDYLVVGFTHILPKGLDHILFVVGLFLLSPAMRPLFWQITAFTVAHTVTLALGVMEIVVLSPAIVEPLIAASIVYVCVENLMTQRLTAWRPAVVFAFGLLHGLGFAGVLAEIGLGRDDFVTGLIAFNIGVEAGQIAVVLICFAATYLIQGQSWYRRAVAIPASAGIGLIAAYWTVERLGFV